MAAAVPSLTLGNSLAVKRIERVHMSKYTAIYSALLIAATNMAGPSPARAAGETVEIYSAGSLRGVVGDVAKEAASAFNIEIKATFGGSGLLRERIEKGETPDLFMSADVGS